jgi:hypothetical protein
MGIISREGEPPLNRQELNRTENNDDRQPRDKYNGYENLHAFGSMSLPFAADRVGGFADVPSDRRARI